MKNYLIIDGASGVRLATAILLPQKGNKVFASFNTLFIKSSLIQYSHLDINQIIWDLNRLPEQIDGLVYCPEKINHKPFSRIKAEDFLLDYQLQVFGAVKIIQSILPKLKKAQLSSIVLFSTVAVQTGFPFHSIVSYSKGTIEGLTRALAEELAPSIRVNCIAPSMKDTPLAGNILNTEEKKEANTIRHPLKKTASAFEIAEAVEFLLSEKSSWITAQILHIDGGISNVRV